MKVKENSLTELRKQISQQDKFIIVSKAITNDALWQKAEKDLSGLDKRLRSEEINPIYQDLATKIVNTEVEFNILKSKAEHLRQAQVLAEQEINALAQIIQQKEFDLIQLNREVNIYKETYDSLAGKIEMIRMVNVSGFGEMQIVSQAHAPKYPMSRGAKKKIAIAGVLGLISGIFLAFMLEILEK